MTFDDMRRREVVEALKEAREHMRKAGLALGRAQGMLDELPGSLWQFESGVLFALNQRLRALMTETLRAMSRSAPVKGSGS